MRERHLWKLRAQAPAVALDQSRRGSGVLWSASKDTAQVDTLMRRWGVAPGARLVVMCPGSRSHIKRWTAEGFARVADRLVRESGAAVVFAGEPGEKPVVDEILAGMTETAHNVVGVTTVRQLGELMRRAALVITNDSAALHLASSLEIPTVAIFGPTDPDKYGPTAARSRLIRRRLFCAPCEQPDCRFSHECMRFIEPEEVYEAASALLNGKGARA
jgi:lipopolysaccharide heptosyltransferase II